MKIEELQEELQQRWVDSATAAKFSGRKADATGIRQVRDFIRAWNLEHPETPVFCRKGAVELFSLSHALKESSRPRPFRPRNKDSRRAQALAALSK